MTWKLVLVQPNSADCWNEKYSDYLIDNQRNISDLAKDSKQAKKTTSLTTSTVSLYSNQINITAEYLC